MNLIETRSDPSTAKRTAIIQLLNDALRRDGEGGCVVITNGLAALPEGVREQLIGAMKSFDTFDSVNDPFAEHDFGTIRVGDVVALFKIDYYDEHFERGSVDPADPKKTRRVLTLMLGSEY